MPRRLRWARPARARPIPVYGATVNVSVSNRFQPPVCVLSVIIVTYNRAHFLERCLEALAPQIKAAGQRAELVILDNASTDQTESVARPYAGQANIRYVRHAENLGVIANITIGPQEFAQGKYVWILGDHNLIAPQALSRLLDELEAHPELDLFYSNFRCASYPNHWPKACAGGFDGEYEYMGNQRTETLTVKHWGELLEKHSSFCTQLYAHIVRREIWADYWRGRAIPPTFTCGLSTFPHTWMLTETCLDQPARFLHEPAITIFNGAQHWGNLHTQIDVYLYGHGDLVKLFRKQSVEAERISDMMSYGRWIMNRNLRQLFALPDAQPWPTLIYALKLSTKRCRWMLPVIISAFFETSNTSVACAFRRCRRAYRQLCRYMVNCRPARWLRNQRSPH